MNNQHILSYHERTKHHFDHYASGPAHIDWNAQPDSFRRYRGTKRVELPLTADTLEAAYTELYQPAAIAPLPFNLNHIAALLELSLGLSAWKQYGSHRWALRCNPSSGNLHPTEGYLILPNQTELLAGVYHYLSHDHVLEQRGCFDPKGAEILENVLLDRQLLLGLTSIPWREAWKYGERAFRYCQHDIGHAIAAVRYAAAALGWRVVVLDHWADTDITTMLGLNRDQDFKEAEREVAEVMLCIGPNQKPIQFEQLESAMDNVKWIGEANILDSNHHYEWPIIDTALKATLKPNTEEIHWTAPNLPPLSPISGTSRAADIIRQRRSAQMFDGATPLKLDAFYRLLDSTLPRNDAPPWDVFPYPPKIHLLIFVHRVTELSPGLYILRRHNDIDDSLRAACQQEQFVWKKPKSCPEHLSFYQLLSGDAQMAARQISCHQDIAADSAFSLGMLAEFEEHLKNKPWNYRRLFWEAGIIGQILYLEAEAVGVRGTGIGCYFDDAVHSLLGLTDRRYQSLYHFTVGTPLIDKRLQTLPPYAHLAR
jgi:SagB-type dehydrogenase family enzyme